MNQLDAIVIGSGPNGLSAAIVLARAGWNVRVYEGAATIGGSARSAELTLPGFVHDVCSTVHALALTSPLFQELDLGEHGLEFVHPEAPFAHPLDDGTAAVCERSIEATGRTLGTDAAAYQRLMEPIAREWEDLSPDILAPPGWPSHPVTLGRFGLKAIRSARALCEAWFDGERARALFAGAAAHSILPLDWLGTAAYGLVLGGSAHAVGWPMARGGSQRLSDALASRLTQLGGEIVTSTPIANIDDLPPSRAILCDVTPKQLLRLAGHHLPQSYIRRLNRFQYGPGVFKVDWALTDPIPWRAKDCARAGTVHVGGTFDEIAASEAACWRGEHPQRPFVLLVQPTLFDPTRAPAGRHVAWAYCHVPHGSTLDMTDRIEDQIERFAPGFADTIHARRVMNCAQMERYNPNLIGGDITGGAQTIGQLLARPVLSTCPYATPRKGLYLCSASTPPGGGVHGMCGYHAAMAVLRRWGSGDA